MKNFISKSLFLFFSIYLFYSCDNHKSPKKVNKETTWVYLESEKILKKDTTNYYLYGKIRNTVLEKINNDEKTDGLFLLKKIRFVNNDDQIEIYEDSDQLGSIFLKIQSIKYLSVYKRDPIHSFEEKDLHETAKKIISK